MKATVKLNRESKTSGFISVRGRRNYASNYKTYSLLIDGVEVGNASRDVKNPYNYFKPGVRWDLISRLVGESKFDFESASHDFEGFKTTNVNDLKSWWRDFVAGLNSDLAKS